MTAQQIYREKVYGNFRKRGKPEKKKNSKFREQRPGMSEDHLKLIRKCHAAFARSSRPANVTI